MAAGRHNVLDAVADSYAELPARRANELTVGDPWREEVSLGPLIDTGQFKRVSDIVAESVAGGAVANACEHGLVVAIVTGAPERAESPADQLRVGMVHINDPSIEDDAYVRLRRAPRLRQRQQARRTPPLGRVHRMALDHDPKHGGISRVLSYPGTFRR